MGVRPAGALAAQVTSPYYYYKNLAPPPPRPGAACRTSPIVRRIGLRQQQQRNSPSPRALSEWSDTLAQGSDHVTTAAASELIRRSAAAHIDSAGVSELLGHLQHALHGEQQWWSAPPGPVVQQRECVCVCVCVCVCARRRFPPALLVAARNAGCSDLYSSLRWQVPWGAALPAPGDGATHAAPSYFPFFRPAQDTQWETHCVFVVAATQAPTICSRRRCLAWSPAPLPRCLPACQR